MTDLTTSSAPMGACSALSGPLTGRVCAPGDKSMSHRSLILGAMASGQTIVTGLLEGDDILATAEAMKAFGAAITRRLDSAGAPQWVIKGVGADGLRTPAQNVDCGNAGTGVRLIMGAAAGYKISATFIGDASLSKRPMGRVLDPLSEMGVTYEAQEGGRLPVKMTSSGTLTPIDYTPPHASAQVKSCVLLAGLRTDGETILREPTLTRDHTENMLEAFGVTVERQAWQQGQIVRLKGPAELTATDVVIPGDPSSAAFAMVAGLIVPGSDLVIENVMMNPTRTGLFETLVEMGGWLRADNFRKFGGEVIADIHVKHSRLRGIVVPKDRAPAMIDEYPILTVAAAFASGQTVMNGIKELRVKESDRIAATSAFLRDNGVNVEEREDGMTVKGFGHGSGNTHPTTQGGGHVVTHHDHRIAMSALVLGLMADQEITIDDASMIATSFPEFFDQMRDLGAKNLRRQTAAAESA